MNASRAPLVIVLATLSACTRHPEPDRLAGPTMGTTYSITVSRRPTGVQRTDLQAEVDDVLAAINRHLSAYEPASEISRFNATTATDWIPVSATLLAAVAQSKQVSEATGGAFDITVGPLVRAWGFGSGAWRAKGVPGHDEIERLRALVGHRKLELRRRPAALRKAIPGLQIDVDGIAPGIAVDLIAGRFESLGVYDYLIEIGGEVRARGRNPAGRHWRVAVEAPVTGVRRPHALVELDGYAVSTSGDYRDYREADGVRISHTIDPRLAAPVTHGLTSVTVIHASTAWADALSTALMVLGAEDGAALARRMGLAALFIERADGKGGYVESETPEFARFRRPLR